MRNFGAPSSIIIQIQNMQNNLKRATLEQRGYFKVPKSAPPLKYRKLLNSFNKIKEKFRTGDSSPVSSEDDKRALRYVVIGYGLDTPTTPIDPLRIRINKVLDQLIAKAQTMIKTESSASNTSAPQSEVDRIIEMAVKGATKTRQEGKPLTQIGVFSVPTSFLSNPDMNKLFGNESNLIQMFKATSMDLEFGQLGNIGDMAFGIMVSIIALSSPQIPKNREEVRLAVERLSEIMSSPQNNVNAYNTNVPNNTNYPSNVNFNYEVNNVNEPSLPFFETFLGKASVVAGVGALSFGILHLFFKNK